MKKTRHYEVEWSGAAEQDLEMIVSYIGVQDGWERAISILDQIHTQADRLYLFPERGRLVPELRAQGIPKYRELVIGPWRLMYKIGDKYVHVLGVIDSRRNVEDILLERFAQE